MDSRQRLIAAVVTCCLSSGAMAADITVRVTDRNGNPVPNVAVFAEFDDDDATIVESRTAEMDQVNTRFAPHILVIQTGTRVEFPNSDTIAHHVYSFSNPNDFMLPLYKGDAHAPVTFEHPGVVTLGCNIHDQMLAYVLVVDGSVFGKTDDSGMVRLDVGEDSPRSIAIWSPRLRANGGRIDKPYQQVSPSVVSFNITDKLRPAHDSEQGSLEWSEY